jgi:hypothetical protein
VLRFFSLKFCSLGRLVAESILNEPFSVERICNDAGFATRRKHVLTSEGSRRADLEIRNIRLADKVNLLVDVTIRHDFIGAGRSGLTQGKLRNPDNPDHILESAAADKIRNYRDAYAVNRQVAFYRRA